MDKTYWRNRGGQQEERWYKERKGPEEGEARRGEEHSRAGELKGCAQRVLQGGNPDEDRARISPGTTRWSEQGGTGDADQTEEEETWSED
ncbi:hypothetical protein NDU88_005014 [Pleurodeles waltl]|uniref:Uncharacterized protein n=1 Tax=Pleurodeles waltl TaxID=8319 RepID=A0AAV7UHP9_PLEWA|nr:hypothetical protein NDU88_005014 [Pleurodeles waltl]